MSRPSVLQKILGWLHAGYPEGIPQQDYYPLLALLARSLKPEEVGDVVNALEAGQRDGYVTTAEDVRVAIERVTDSPALRNDERRIERHLRELGWEIQPSLTEGAS